MDISVPTRSRFETQALERGNGAAKLSSSQLGITFKGTSEGEYTMREMTRTGAIKTFVEEGTRRVSMKEMKAFKDACTDKEWKDYGDEALKHLGAELK